MPVHSIKQHSRVLVPTNGLAHHMVVISRSTYRLHISLETSRLRAAVSSPMLALQYAAISCSLTMRFRAASPIQARLMPLLHGAPGTGKAELWTRASLSIHWLWNVYLQQEASSLSPTL